MSRIGNQPIPLNKNIEVKVSGSEITVKGPKAELKHVVPAGISIDVVENEIVLKRADDSKESKSKHGLTRSLVNNMVVGVDKGFQKDLEIRGVGYRANVQGSILGLSLGYSHPIQYQIPEGIQIEVAQNIIKVSGYDKQRVGQTAAEIRAYRRPEPYKGKGIRYVGEYVMQKEGKTV